MTLRRDLATPRRRYRKRTFTKVCSIHKPQLKVSQEFKRSGECSKVEQQVEEKALTKRAPGSEIPFTPPPPPTTPTIVLSADGGITCRRQEDGTKGMMEEGGGGLRAPFVLRPVTYNVYTFFRERPDHFP